MVGEQDDGLTRFERPELAGLGQVLSLPAVVLFWSAFGFGAFAQGAGFDWAFTGASTALIWALPAQVVLVDQMAQGAGLFATALAVTLTAVRLLPLTVSLMPILRADRMALPSQFLASHFIAVTVWVMAMTALPKMRRDQRARYYFGLAAGMLVMSVVGTVLGHQAAAILPAAIAGGLLFLTPLYFLLSMSETARDVADKGAILAGLVLGPIFHLITPELDLALTGFVGGTLSYVLARAVGR